MVIFFPRVCCILAALDYFKSYPVDPVDVAAFEAFCGVGVVITPEQIAEKASAFYW